MKLSKLINTDEYVRLSGDPKCEISVITTNAEYESENALLIILKDTSLSGIRESCLRFSAIICAESLFEELCGRYDGTLVAVKSPRLAWAMAESRIRAIDYAKMKFVAVTGTNGKTTTARLIQAMLEAGGAKTGFIGTGFIESLGVKLSDQFYSMTTPDPNVLYPAIKKMEMDGVDYVIMEVSSHALYFEKTAPIHFELSLFTNISPEHLDFHGTIEEYTATKLKLIPQSKLAVLNIDDHRLRAIYENIKERKRSFGVVWDSDCRATDLDERGFEGFRFIYREKDFSFLAVSPLVGKFNIYNALGAFSAAIALGVPPCIAKSSLLNFEGVRGRFECVYKGKIRVIIDYAHSEEAFRALLSSARAYTSGRLTVLFGCGGERYREKRAVMGSIAEISSDLIYLTSDNPRGEPPERIFDDIISGFSKNCGYKLIPDRAEAIRRAILDSKDGDTIFLVGKGAEEYNLDASGYHIFNEREILMSAIEEREAKKNESRA